MDYIIEEGSNFLLPILRFRGIRVVLPVVIFPLQYLFHDDEK